MKRIRSQHNRKKKKIERRLANGRKQDGDNPTLGNANIVYEIAERTKAISNGGIGVVQMLVEKVGLAELIDEKVEVLKQHRPYHESDHVLNIAYNALCGGQALEHIETRRKDEVYLDSLGTQSIPGSSTAGDFCRRFEAEQIEELMTAINEARLRVWKEQPPSFFSRVAKIEADGTMVPTLGECKEGMDINHKGVWGYHPLVVSLANTQEPLFLVNRSGNRPSHEGVVPYFDKAIELCRRAGFKDVLLRGDTDFSLTTEFDRWDDDGVRFVFGYDAKSNLKLKAEGCDGEFAELTRHAKQALKTKPRRRPANIKEPIVVERGYKNIKLKSEDVAEFDYKPTKCKRDYRMVVVRKNLSVEKGEIALFDDVRYFFYITNDRGMTKAQVVAEAGKRCNQENLIAQLKSGVRALHAPVNTLNANWAYMVMAALAWNIKAWMALMLPIHPRWLKEHTHEQNKLLKMEFRTFLQALIQIPAQIVKTGRRIVYRLLSWNPWQPIVFRLVEVLRR